VQQLAITVEEADDAHLAEEVGPAFYTHLRGLNHLADWRHDSVERALALYEKAERAAAPEPAVAGHALLVLQRTAFVCEDLLALLWALGRPKVWRSLTEYYARDLTKTARGFLEGTRDLHRFFLIPDDEAIAAQDLSNEKTAALQAFAATSRAGLETDLKLVCAFWAAHDRVAKATMHGFGLVALMSKLAAESAVCL